MATRTKRDEVGWIICFGFVAEAAEWLDVMDMQICDSIFGVTECAFKIVSLNDRFPDGRPVRSIIIPIRIPVKAAAEFLSQAVFDNNHECLGFEVFLRKIQREDFQCLPCLIVDFFVADDLRFYRDFSGKYFRSGLVFLE